MATDETRDGIELTNLDQPLDEGADATKRDLLDYLDAMSDAFLPELADRPLSTVRVRPGQPAFMQKNVPKYTPDWVRTHSAWAAKSKREVRYAVCDDRRTLLWLGNQRCVEYHAALFHLADEAHPTDLILDIDPPEGAPFAVAVAAARLVRAALAAVSLEAAVKTSGAKGVHLVVPIVATAVEDVAAAGRAIAARAERLDPALATTAFVLDERAGKVFLDSTRVGGATLIAAFSPRLRPGTPVSHPVAWDDLDAVSPRDFTLRSVRPPVAFDRPSPQALPRELVDEGHSIPVARVQAMHAGLRRARERRAEN